MRNHLGDTNKMVDTPRTEAEVNRQKCWSDDLITIDANFACQLERELNAANERIQRLEEAGSEAICPLEYASRVRIWNKAKEAKL